MGINVKNVQKEAIDFFGSSCYLMCLSYIYDKDSRDNTDVMWSNLLLAKKLGYCDKNGYVTDPVSFINKVRLNSSIGKAKTVIKVNIKSLSELPEKGMYAVMYRNGNYTHFVVATKKDGIVFDPMGGTSNTLKYGKIESYRHFEEQ